MAVRIGPFDPLQLIFNLMNNLMRRGLISYPEARSILKESLDPNMSEDEKEKLLDSLIKKVNG
jgi:hypothetical protein